MLMPYSDTYFLELSAVVLLKVATKCITVLLEDFKYYYCSIINFILNSGKRHIFKVSAFHGFAFLKFTFATKLFFVIK